MPKQTPEATQKTAREPRPRQLNADLCEADELLRRDLKLPPRLWAAWMAQRTGMHTYEICCDASGVIVAFGTTVHFERQIVGGEYAGLRKSGESLNYSRPSQIARRVARSWDSRPILSRDELFDAIMLLEGEDNRGFALEGAGILSRYSAAEIGQGYRAVQLRIEDLTKAASMPTLDFAPMTEPREVFEAKLSELQERSADMVGAFFGGGE